MKQYSFLEEAENMPDYTKVVNIKAEEKDGNLDFSKVVDISKKNEKLPDLTRATKIELKEVK